MDLTLIKLALEKLHQNMEALKNENDGLKERIEDLEKKTSEPVPVRESWRVKEKMEDILLDTKDVLNILGISYNTLQAIVQKGFLNPLRINQRRIRYSKQAIYAYISSKSN
ncbi:MAG: helix-turn-helix domain-containing protein [Crocinitomicaceae bacterium]|nr:helix-turn-helix domain-containing protein [Crocinitomicaceae bacterium]